MSAFYLYIWLGLCLCSCWSSAGAAPSYIPLEAWRGEYLPQGYGAFYTKIKLKGFKKNERGTSISTNVFLQLQETTLNRRYIASQAVQEANSEVQIWKIPAGNYVISKISLNDNGGRLRSWQVTPENVKRATLGVRNLFLSNYGMISLAPAAKNLLAVRITPKPNTFKNAFNHNTFAGVIDGFDLKVQETLGGRHLFSDSTENFGSTEEARKAFSYQRQIAMVYRLDIGDNRRYATKIINTISAQDLDLRRCYMEELDKDASIKGNISLSFILDRSTGTMQKFRFKSGNLNSQNVATCLYYTLGKMQFPVAAQLQGNITFFFSYSDEQARSAP